MTPLGMIQPQALQPDPRVTPWPLTPIQGRTSGRP